MYIKTSFLLIFIILILPKSVFAQTSVKQLIKVSPVILRLSLEPGKVTDYRVDIQNLSSQALPVKVNVDSFNPDDEEKGFSLAPSDNKNPLENWINIKESDLLIGPNSTQQEHIQIKVPDAVPLGSYYSMIYFQPLVSSTQIPVNARVGVLTLANIGVQDPNQQSAQIVTFQFSKGIFEDNPIYYTVRIRNNSLNYFTSKAHLTIKPIFGPQKEFDLEEKTILPGKIRRWDNQFNVDSPFNGIYFAKLTVSSGAGNTISKTSQFYVFPLTKLAIGILLLLIIIYPFVYRKRVLKALKLLLKGT